MTDYKEVFQLAQDKGYVSIMTALLIANEYVTQSKNRGTIGEIDADLIKLNKAIEKIDFCELSLIQKWLRDKHSLNIGLVHFRGGYWEYRVHYKYRYGSSDTYEQALLEGVYEALKLI